MALAMARPMKDKWHTCVFRQRVPADLKWLKGSSVTLPVGDRVSSVTIGEFVQISLRTKVAAEGKTRHSIVAEALGRFWQAHRSGPQKLTAKQAAALSGRLYHFLAERYGDDPGEPDLWIKIELQNELTRAGKYGLSSLLIGDEAQKAAALEARFGGITDALLARKQLIVDADSRTKVLKAVQAAMEDVVSRLKRNAQFDFSDDPAALRFPAWEPQEAPTKTAKGRLTVKELFDAWATANAANKAPSSIKRYRGIFTSLAKFTKDESANDLTGDDIHAWAIDRRDNEQVSPGTINSVDLVAVSAVFKWGMSREGGCLVAANPAKIDRLEEPRPTAEREKAFRANEVRAILTLAASVEDDPTYPEAAHAKRWCPWLAAYTGARIAELTGLKGSDVRYEGDIPVIDIRRSKTAQPRTVPVHEHLIDKGFMSFAKERGSKPLFFDPKRHKADAQTTPAESQSKMLAKWVRDSVKLDPDVAPSHAWRHTWKSKATRVGIDIRLRDAIVGHSQADVARLYEAVDVETMAEAMARFPRYPLG